MSRVSLTFGLTFLLLLSIQFNSFAQVRNCISQDLHEENMLNPDYAKAFNEKVQKAYTYKLGDEKVLCPNPVLIPIAVHFQGITNPDLNCLRALAQNQIDILNNDTQGSNADISNWINNDSQNFPGVNYSETCLEFCIANQSHPSGYGLINGDPAVTVNQTTGSFDSDWSGYLNVWVRNIGALGFSPLGGDGDGDGVTIDVEAFGSGAGCNGVVPDPPYDLGRTLTHEVGHYLLLNHIWGSGCSVDDGIADTPDQASSNSGCPSSTASSCGSLDLHMNYMDYTNDACMYMFSQGQGTVMENYTGNSLSILTTNAPIVCNGQSGPTCFDGIQNGNETGIDCGGPDCPACAICSSQGNNTSDEWIESVVIGSYTNISGDNGGYADFTGTPFDVTQNATINFTLTPGWSGTVYPEYFRIWADLNNDYDFDDAGEMLYDQGSANTNGNQTGSFIIPTTSIIGETTLRVSMKYNNSPEPCETFTFGEVEDYTINIVDLPPAPPNDLCSNAQVIFAGNFPGTLIDATTTGNPVDCAGLTIDGSAVWYYLKSNGSETYNFDVCGASFDTRLHLFSGNCFGLNCVTSNDNFCGDDAQIIYSIPSNPTDTDFYLLVSGTGASTGTFLLNVSANALAVELSSFTGKITEYGNEISWTTASESSLSAFEIQRSNNLFSWETLDVVSPKGSVSVGATYQTIDKDYFGISYYRILSKNLDGTQQLSEFIQLKRDDEQLRIDLYPNPASDFVTIDIQSAKNASGNLEVRDVSGKIIHAQEVKIVNGRQQQRLDIEHWAAGVYFLQWQLDGEIKNSRVVKK